jgi:uncharacterized protein
VIILFDSGIWISAFQFGGLPMRAIEHAFLQDRLVFCDQIIQEVRAVLARKFLWRDNEVRALLMNFLSDAIHADVAGTMTGVSRDPKDDMLFECAVAAEANLIISGDQDVLSVRNYQGIRVVTARKYLEQSGIAL